MSDTVQDEELVQQELKEIAEKEKEELAQRLGIDQKELTLYLDIFITKKTEVLLDIENPHKKKREEKSKTTQKETE
ncbi:MAG: hypothetical protein IJ934_07655 [Acetobacter sp.]|nr:hypothetical protein [Acetobacter sp.]